MQRSRQAAQVEEGSREDLVSTPSAKHKYACTRPTARAAAHPALSSTGIAVDDVSNPGLSFVRCEARPLVERPALASRWRQPVYARPEAAREGGAARVGVGAALRRPADVPQLLDHHRVRQGRCVCRRTRARAQPRARRPVLIRACVWTDYYVALASMVFEVLGLLLHFALPAIAGAYYLLHMEGSEVLEDAQTLIRQHLAKRD